MSAPVITVSPDARLKEAARMMMEKKIGCLPVVENDTLVGLLTESDILRYVATL
jgi:CBS domain-containing protein